MAVRGRGFAAVDLVDCHRVYPPANLVCPAVDVGVLLLVRRPARRRDEPACLSETASQSTYRFESLKTHPYRANRAQ